MSRAAAYPETRERLQLGALGATRTRRAKRSCATDHQQYQWLRANFCVEYPDAPDVSPIANSHDAAAYLRAAFPLDVDGVEHFLVMALNAKNVPIAIFEVHRGGRTNALVDIAATLRGVILVNAVGFVCAHNHPSGDPQPSEDDVTITNRLAHAAHLANTPLLDHIVFGSGDRFVSLLDVGLFQPHHRLSIP